MKKIIFLVLLLIIPIAQAATQDFDTVFDLDFNLVSGSVNDVGSVLIKKSQPISDIIELRECKNLTIDNYDKIKLLEKNYIELSNGLVILNNIPKIIISDVNLTFSCDGENYNLTVNPLPIVNINISNTAVPGLDITYDNNNFKLLEDKIINFVFDIDDDIMVNEYPIIFDISNKRYTKYFKILENKSFNIINSSINDTNIVNTGESKFIGNLNVENIGNINFDLNLSAKGVGKELLIFPTFQTLFRKSTSIYAFNVLVPSTYATGNYSIELFLNEKNIKNISIIVKDNSNPEIEDVEFDKESLFSDCKLSAIITDNIEVTKVELKINNRTVEMNKDNQLYYYTQKYTNKSEYNFTICAYDDQLNQACVAFEKEFDYLNPFSNISNELTMPTLQRNVYGKREIFNLTEDVEINISIKNFFNSNKIPIENFEIRLLDEEQNYDIFNDINNYTLPIYNGKNYIELKSDDLGSYYFDLEFQTPHYVETISYMRIYGEIKNYSITDEFKMSWNGIENGFKCVNHDTGEYENSYKTCCGEYAIDVSARDISIPTTIAERQKFDNDVKKLEEDYENKTQMLTNFVIIIFTLLVVLGGITYFIMYVRPFARFKIGKTLTGGFEDEE